MIIRLLRLLKIHQEGVNRQIEIHLNLHLLPILVAGLGILYAVTGFKGWLIFFVGIGGAWLMGGLWIYSIRRNLWVERSIHLAWATAGESVPEHIKLVNKGWLPVIWVEISDESQTLESPLRIVSDVGQRASRNRNLSHLFKHRGVYTLGPTILRSSDPFGIYTITMHDQHSNNILVTPPVLPLSQLHIASGGWTGDERYQRGAIERNISDTGLRNYVAGDSLRRIHWHASAHFDSLIVRQQEGATSRDWCIYVDMDRDVQAGIGEQSTLELTIVLAASLAVRGLREYRRVGIVMAGPQYTSLAPAADPSQGWRILRALATAEAGRHSLAELIRRTTSRPTGTVIIITPSPNPAWVAAADQHFQGSRLALLVDPTDFGSPIAQKTVIATLVHSRIPYIRMPGSLLEEAYTQGGEAQKKHVRGGEALKRYLQQGRQAWQSMD